MSVKKLIAFALVVLIVIIIGYCSNRMSKSACVRPIATTLSTRELKNRMFYLLSYENDADLCGILDSINAKYIVVSPRTGEDDYYPCMRIESNLYIPYIVLINYSWEHAPEIGAGCTNSYFCFLGIVVDLGESNRRDF